jgi:hypothetical protein
VRPQFGQTVTNLSVKADEAIVSGKPISAFAASIASPRDFPGARLKEMVTAGKIPHPLFESRIVDKKLDVVRPCEGVIAEGELH